MAVLNEGLQFRLLAGDLKNTGTILESVMRVRQYWDCGLIFGQVIYPVCDQGDLRDDPGISNLVLLFLFVSVKDLLSSTSGSETRHLTNHTH